jgi:hypothetical protein
MQSRSHAQRNHHRIARLVLLWFALYLGVAIAAPLVQGQGLQLVCTASGSIKLIAAGTGGTGSSLASHALECPLCAGPGAPPPWATGGPVAVALPAFVAPAQPGIRLAHAGAAPPPARGPPSAA